MNHFEFRCACVVIDGLLSDISIDTKLLNFLGSKSSLVLHPKYCE